MADNKSREVGSLEVKVRASVDVSDAISGLKALQREAKKASQALRELENAGTVYEVEAKRLKEEGSREELVSLIRELETKVRELESQVGNYDDPEHVKKYNAKGGDWVSSSTNKYRAWFTDVPTCELTNELVRRKGVSEYCVDAHGGSADISFNNGVTGEGFTIEGPARIIINRD